MGFIRPELRAQFFRWREVIAALAVAGLGLWGAVESFGLVRWLALCLCGLGVLLAFGAVQRVRFDQGGGGPGMVQVDERRIAYFGPLTGGVVDFDDLISLDLGPSTRGPAVWTLRGMGGAMIEVPSDATGAEALFDLFSTLPGLRATDLLQALEQPRHSQRLWERKTPRLH